ncbi:MAG: ATP-dependent Clp protease adaptor ClpS [Flavobacteriales bacterium]
MITFNIDTEEEVAVEIEQDNAHTLMLYNDDVNTFDHVIESLIEVCNHDMLQAEQVAWIVHTKGKCDVKHGDRNRLEKMCLQLLDRKLSAVIEQ